MVAVTCRTEYLTARHQWGARGALGALGAGLFAFLVLGIVDVDPTTTAVVVFGAVALSAAIAAWGRLGKRGAVLLSVDDETVTFGNEASRLTSQPLSSVVSVSMEPVASSTSMSGRVMTVAGLRYLSLEFADPEHPHGTTDIWQVAVVDTDPAVSAVVERLEAAARQVSPTVRVTKSRRGDGGAVSKPDVAVQTPQPASFADVVDSEPDVPRVANAGSDEAAQRLWEAATVRHDGILRDYGAYELESELMLRFPAVTDITLEPVQNFHDALGEAQALRTDAYPGRREIADDYQQAVRRLSRAWIACESSGRKVGTGYLGRAERDDLDTALKLVNHAKGSATAQEQAAYYQRAHQIVVGLRDQGALHPPAGAMAQLEANAQRALN